MTREATVLAGLENATDMTVAFARYWLSMPTADLIPSRRDFAPERIPGLLANLVIHELVSPEHLKLRLVGTSVVADYGQEITGRNYLDFVEAARRPKASRAIFLICEQPSAMLVQLRSISEGGKLLTRESVAFPMRDEEGRARLVYFCSSPPVERTAYQEDRDALAIMKVLDRRYIDIGGGIPEFTD
ncbi:MAG: PAS domain-containing protein [Thalassobaculaceae bacterium]|nr:PAS domain-containing protein [Thalassobaculaceae bacterium]